MKKISLFLFVSLVFFVQNVESQDLKWITDYEEALVKSKKEKKNILIYFTGSDWCAPCRMLKRDLLETETFQDLSKDYILLYIDIPRNQDLLTPEQYAHNKALLPKFNKRGVFPLFVVLDSRERMLDDISGYGMNGEVSYHIDLLRKYNRG